MRIQDTSGQDVTLVVKSNNKPYIFTVVMLLIAIGLYLFVAPSFSNWSNSDHSVPMQRLRLASVEKGDFVRDLSVQARVVASVSPRLYR